MEIRWTDDGKITCDAGCQDLRRTEPVYRLEAAAAPLAGERGGGRGAVSLRRTVVAQDPAFLPT